MGVLWIQFDGYLDLDQCVMKPALPLKPFGPKSTCNSIVRHALRARRKNFLGLTGLAVIPQLRLVPRQLVVGGGKLRIDFDGVCEAPLGGKEIPLVL